MVGTERDLKHGWDFTKTKDRNDAIKKLKRFDHLSTRFIRTRKLNRLTMLLQLIANYRYE